MLKNQLYHSSRILLLIALFFNFSILKSQTTIQGSFDFDGFNRTYRLYIPESYSPNHTAPLILNLHGYGSNAFEQEFYGNFRPIADTAGFLVVHPNGTLDATNTQFWNTFGTSGVDDVGFLSALVDTINQNYPIDLERVYSTGMSNGGFMSYSLACNLSNRIAAIASVTGTMVFSALNLCNSQRPVPVMQIHGTADGVVPYNGNALFVPVPTLNNFWINFNNCFPEPIVTLVPDIDPNDGCTAEHYLWQGGDNSSTVEHYKIIGGGHTWPGAPVVVGITNMDFSASEEIWRFFRQYNLNGLITSLDELVEAKADVSVWPNPANGITSLSFNRTGKKLITILDAKGRTINNLTTTDSQVKIKLENAGLFFIVVEIDGTITSMKLINL